MENFLIWMIYHNLIKTYHKKKNEIFIVSQDYKINFYPCSTGYLFLTFISGNKI